jgi:hypothetical protein
MDGVLPAAPGRSVRLMLWEVCAMALSFVTRLGLEYEGLKEFADFQFAVHLRGHL